MNNKKEIPKWIQNKTLSKVIKSDAGIILSYWVFQGLLYMDIREKIFKIILDILLTGLFYKVGFPLVVAVLVAHTMNMIFNGHYYVMKHNLGKIDNDPEKFIQYIENLFNRVKPKGYLLGAAAYGSLSRNEFKPTSDFDVRIFPKKGFINWLKTILWILGERSRAFIQAFPLDIYAFELKSIDSKMRSDEPPIIFLDSKNKLMEKYHDHVLFKDFAMAFREKYVREK